MNRVNNGWYIHIDHNCFRNQFGDLFIIDLINKKHKVEFWDNHWCTHICTHRKNGKRKCLIGIEPEIYLYLINFNPTSRILTISVRIEASDEDDYYTCAKSCDDLKINIPSVSQLINEVFESKVCSQLIAEFC